MTEIAAEVTMVVVIKHYNFQRHSRCSTEGPFGQVTGHTAASHAHSPYTAVLEALVDGSSQACT